MKHWKLSGVKPKELADAPEFPVCGMQVWTYFVDLCRERVDAKSRITASAVRDWCWVTGIELELWERKAIRALDITWVNAR